MVAPLGEKASPLEKYKASKDWSLCPLELIQALLELLHAPLQLIWAPLELPKTLTMPFFQKNVEICHFCSETLTYDVFGPIILDYAPGEFFCWHFYAWRWGRILIMPECLWVSLGWGMRTCSSFCWILQMRYQKCWACGPTKCHLNILSPATFLPRLTSHMWRYQIGNAFAIYALKPCYAEFMREALTFQNRYLFKTAFDTPTPPFPSCCLISLPHKFCIFKLKSNRDMEIEKCKTFLTK